MRKLSGILFLLLLTLFLVSCDEKTGIREAIGDAKSSNARLKELVVSDGSWEYEFNNYDTEYNIAVSNEIESIKIKPKTEHIFATVRVNNSSVDSGASSESIPLDVGRLHFTRRLCRACRL